MSGTCEECGGDVTAKDRNGWYRDKCWDCIKEASLFDAPHRNPDPPEYDE